jgi:hypothetical protein
MLIVTNKMQSNTIFFIVVKVLHVSGGFPTHHQELKNCACSIWYLLGLVAATANVVEMELEQAYIVCQYVLTCGQLIVYC